jgi:GT2 family glycosyltransferase
MIAADVIIITAGRKRFLERCLSIVLQWQDVTPIIVVNGHDEETTRFLKEISVAHRCLVFSVSEEKIPKSRARNRGIGLGNAPLVYFLDDDAVPREDAMSIARNGFDRHPEIDVIGGPNVTPDESPFFERMIGYVLSSPFTAGRMRRRYGIAAHEEIDVNDSSLMLCNLAVRRKVFEQEKLRFDERLEYNEENLLLQQLRLSGHRMMYDPRLVVSHSRRSSLFSYMLQVFKSGEGRALMTVILPRSLSPGYLFPAIFLCYLASLPVCQRMPFGTPLLVYLGISVLEAVRIMIIHQECFCALPVLSGLPLVSHLSYGAGFLWGMRRLMQWRS